MDEDAETFPCGGHVSLPEVRVPLVDRCPFFEMSEGCCEIGAVESHRGFWSLVLVPGVLLWLQRTLLRGRPVRSVVVHEVRRIGRQQPRLLARAEQERHIEFDCGVAAEQPMVAKNPEVAWLSDRFLRERRHVVRVRETTVVADAVQQVAQVAVIEP
jgi:hypothetical protein